MEEKQCKSCEYYIQHLALGRRKLYCVNCGHCTFAKAKGKKPDTKACEHYIQGASPVDAFATKEYLSKELLQYVLNLDLLPEIEDEA